MPTFLNRLIRFVSPPPLHNISPRERSLDETIESTFPASDPLSTIPAPEPDLERTGQRDDRTDAADQRSKRART
jgi:hypothetical protein